MGEERERRWGRVRRAGIGREAVLLAGRVLPLSRAGGLLVRGASALRRRNGYGDRHTPDVLTGPDFGCVLHESLFVGGQFSTLPFRDAVNRLVESQWQTIAAEQLHWSLDTNGGGE